MHSIDDEFSDRDLNEGKVELCHRLQSPCSFSLDRRGRVSLCDGRTACLMLFQCFQQLVLYFALFYSKEEREFLDRNVYLLQFTTESTFSSLKGKQNI